MNEKPRGGIILITTDANGLHFALVLGPGISTVGGYPPADRFNLKDDCLPAEGDLSLVPRQAFTCFTS